MNAAVKKGAIEDNLDGKGDADASSAQSSARTQGGHRQGRIEPDEIEADAGRKVARRLGWMDKDEFPRNPERWVDWDEFLDSHTQRVSEISDKLRRSNAAAAAAIDEANKRRREEAEAQVRKAAEEGDADAVIKAAKTVAETSKPPQLVTQWIESNPWFDSDPDAREVARAVSNRLAAQGLSVAEQLEAAEKRVKTLFPQHFKTEERARREPDPDDEGEVRMSQVRRPRVVEEGSRGDRGSSSKKAKGFADLPADVRTTFDKKFRIRGVDPEKYAARYWAEQG